VELADGPTGRGEVTKGGCSFAWNISVTMSPVLSGRREGLDQTWRCRSISDLLLAYSLKIPLAKNHVLCCNNNLRLCHESNPNRQSNAP
jgi:hypothetical protein